MFDVVIRRPYELQTCVLTRLLIVANLQNLASLHLHIVEVVPQQANPTVSFPVFSFSHKKNNTQLSIRYSFLFSHKTKPNDTMKLVSAAGETAKQANLHSFKATYVGEKKIDPKYSSVVGIDLGTAFSGISILACDNPDSITCGSPGATNARDETKEPTVLLQLGDGSWLFGNKALRQYDDLVAEAQRQINAIDSDEHVNDFLRREGISLFKYYKMQLKNKTRGYETLEAKSTFGDSYSLMSLMSLTLEFLSKFAIEEIQKGWLGGAYKMSQKDIRWVVTVPAIWNDFGKSFMRKAAFRAGLMESETSDQLLFALEPEAAAIAVQGAGSAFRNSRILFQEGRVFLILDIGGGTVDITIHRVSSVAPLELHVIADPVGGPLGGMFVDAQFKTFLKLFFGDTRFERLKRYCPVEMTEVMDDFRKKKESFKPKQNKPVKISLADLYTGDESRNYDLPPISELAAQYNEKVEAGLQFDLSSKRARDKMDRAITLHISPGLMESFFQPTLKGIGDLVQPLLDEHRDVDTIVVVGGYGSSQVVSEEIQRRFGPDGYGKNVIIPSGDLRPQAAVVHGAAYFGLNTRVIETRPAPYTFGVRSNILWFKGCGYPESDAKWDEELKEMRVNDVFSTIVNKGDRVSPFQEFPSNSSFSALYQSQSVVSFDVYSSSAFCPKKTTEKTCEKLGTVTVPCRSQDDTFGVIFTFGEELKVEVVSENGDRRKILIDMDP